MLDAELASQVVMGIMDVQISAKKGNGVDELLETVALVAEVEQLMSNPDRAAAGTVLEAHLDRRVGPIATLLVQTGTLHVGDVVVSGSAYGKVGCFHTPPPPPPPPPPSSSPFSTFANFLVHYIEGSISLSGSLPLL